MKNNIWGQALMSSSDFRPGESFDVFGCHFKCYRLSDNSLIFCEKGQKDALTEHEFALWLHAQEALRRRYGRADVSSVADFFDKTVTP